MKKSLLVTLSSAVLISGVMLFNNSTEDNSIHLKKSKKSNATKVMSERKRKMKGQLPFDKPDMFEKFHAQIRTKTGKNEPDYKQNYTFEEYQKAVRSAGLSKSTNNIVWTERGPGNVSGRTRGIIVDFKDTTNNTWFAGSAGGGIWKTTDAGETWSEKTFKNLNLATTSLVQSKSNPDVMYAGTGEGFGGGGAIKGNGIFKSVDHGETWTQITSTAGNSDFSYVNRLVVDPADENILLAATNTCIMKSIDGGETWAKKYEASDRVQQILADPQDFNVLYAAERNVGVFKSTDAGETWTKKSNGIESAQRIEIAISPSTSNILYLSVQAGGDSHFYQSKDAAESWKQIVYSNDVDPKWLGSQGWYDNTLAVHPFNDNIVYVGGIDLWKAELDTVSGTSEVGVKSVETENTNKIFGFINWGGPYAGGGLGLGKDFYNTSWYKDVVDVLESDYTSVEVVFGPGKKQKAYRFAYDGTKKQYAFQDYIEVPFEVWDIDNNKQLSISFIDWKNNGVFDLIPYDQNNVTREYLSINAVEYSETPDTNLGKDDGVLYKNIYSMWLYAISATSWNASNLPDAKITINYGSSSKGKAKFTQLSYWWKDVKDPLYSHADHHNLSLIKTGESSFRIVNGNDGGVAYSDNGGETWKQPTNGYNSTQFYGADKHPTKDEYIGGTQDNGSFKSEIDENASSATAYAEVLGGDGFVGVWNNENPDEVIVALYNNRFYRNTNNSNDWRDYVAAQTGMTDANDDSKSAFISSIDKTKLDGEFLVSTGGSGVWRSDNFAENWTLAQMDSNYYFSTYRTPIAISNADQRVVWAGAANNYIQVSTDGALTFKRAAGYDKIKSYFVSGLATHPTDPNTAFMLFSQSASPKIVKTTDMGQTWTDISGFEGNETSSNGFPNVAVYDLLIMPYNTDIYWACTEIGIFVSEDAGTSWNYMNDPLFPAVSVWEANIVGDQVVLATHGRGIWTATIPELANYNPQPVAKVPVIKGSTELPGLMKVDVNLRSDYDSTLVMFNDEVYAKILNTAAVDTTIEIPVTKTEKVVLRVVAYKDSETFKTPSFEKQVFVANSVVDTYTNDFNAASNDFVGDFEITTIDGFEDGAIHSGHNYADNKDHTFMLLSPIKVAASDAKIKYNDIAIVEPGDPETKYGDEKYWDYVIVEGSKDGVNWFALADGYDCDKYPEWRAAYDASSSIDKSLFRYNEINLLEHDSLSAGDEVFVRFRLHADQFTNGWGWAIDGLAIQGDLVDVEEWAEVPTSFELYQNYPNPFNPSTKIKFAVPSKAIVKLTIFNTLGEEIETLVNDEMEPGYYIIDWNASRYASGAYFYRLSSDDYVKSKKLMLIK